MTKKKCISQNSPIFQLYDTPAKQWHASKTYVNGSGC